MICWCNMQMFKCDCIVVGLVGWGVVNMRALIVNV